MTVTVDEIHADAVVGIMNQHGPSEIHEHGAGQSGARTGLRKFSYD